MKNGSGSHEQRAAKATSFLTQKTWRIVGALSLSLAGGMAWFGAKMDIQAYSPIFLMVYWAIFLLALLVTFYMVLLDIRYIRLSYLQDERDLFLETLGDEELRQTLRDLQTAEAEQSEEQQNQ